MDYDFMLAHEVNIYIFWIILLKGFLKEKLNDFFLYFLIVFFSLLGEYFFNLVYGSLLFTSVVIVNSSYGQHRIVDFFTLLFLLINGSFTWSLYFFTILKLYFIKYL